MQCLLFKIGFLQVDVWDLFDILIVGLLLYQLYQLLKGSIALNIFVGMVLLFLSYQVFQALGMDLLSSILFQFTNLGFISLIIIFQPEVRRFLLLLGTNTLRQRDSFWSRLLGKEDPTLDATEEVEEIRRAFLRLARSKTGALIVCTRDADPETIISGGTPLNANISYGLIVSIFHKESPLHDGAVVIENRRISRASAILPVSENTTLPKSVGLRHRAAVGVSEKIDVGCFIVSEETGKISFAHGGHLERGLGEKRLTELLNAYL
ncbi:diadenylate cyclase CdaA [Neolewinella lacunae]|uniref:Diadenylate cyclase n=1 Tax=Neolewinella lacunae TaxID=1517758 RepID=A0A923PGH7_9BACT|nr:diadenylate cyclase CdaA [Neolewinella lacunae]MBC6993645.1 TIGR00159 family protein [Neolewinella lacunae]MDN3634727.1 diadenylate cyclase CdaA [Neolewinella lacunae]